jgi:hypothetical protein
VVLIVTAELETVNIEFEQKWRNDDTSAAYLASSAATAGRLVKFMTQLVKIFLVFYGRFIILGTKARNSSVS